MANDTISGQRKVGTQGAQAKPIESSFSTLQRTGAEIVCDEARQPRDQTNASAEQKQNELNATNRAGSEEAKAGNGEEANCAAATEQPMADDTTSGQRKVGTQGAQAKPIESSFSTLQRTGAEIVCDEARQPRDQTNASADTTNTESDSAEHIGGAADPESTEESWWE